MRATARNALETQPQAAERGGPKPVWPNELINNIIIIINHTSSSNISSISKTHCGARCCEACLAKLNELQDADQSDHKRIRRPTRTPDFKEMVCTSRFVRVILAQGPC